MVLDSVALSLLKPKKQPPTSQQEVICYLFGFTAFRAFVISFVDVIWSI